jgi:hypothetical protein
MAKKKSERPNTLNQLKETAVKNVAPTSAAKKTRKEIPNKGRGNYDLPSDMLDEIRAISAKWKAPASGIAELLLKNGLEAYRQGLIEVEPHLTPTESFKYLYGIDSGYSK